MTRTLHSRFHFGVAAFLALALTTSAALAGPSGRGKLPGKHESNSLKKAAKDVQYGVRKSGENLSVDTHRALGRNSVRKSKKKGKTYIVTPSGKKVSMKSPRNNNKKP